MWRAWWRGCSPAAARPWGATRRCTPWPTWPARGSAASTARRCPWTPTASTSGRSPRSSSASARRRCASSASDQLEVRRVQRAGRLEVLAHVAGPVRDDAPARVAVPGVAGRPGGALEALLQRAVGGRLDLRAHGERGVAVALELDRLADVAGLRLQVGDD